MTGCHKAESDPVRCEICHQTDLFDRRTNTCGRCQKIEITKNPAEERDKTIHQVFDSLILGHPDFNVDYQIHWGFDIGSKPEYTVGNIIF